MGNYKERNLGITNWGEFYLLPSNILAIGQKALSLVFPREIVK